MFSTRQALPIRSIAHASRQQCTSACHLLKAHSEALRLTVLRRSAQPHITVRHATHGTQGRANGPKNGPGKRLGAKKTGDEYVIPGNIIFRQRGTKWYPGDNCGMGRDHTIYATETGFVKYYRNPSLHPKRRYIGVVFDRTQALPASPHAARRRRLGMYAVPRTSLSANPDETDTVISSSLPPTVTNTAPQPATNVLPVSSDLQTEGVALGAQGGMTRREVREKRRRTASGRVPGTDLKMRPDYSYRESNYDIGRAAERAGIKVKEFHKGDRFLAWRKTTVRRAKVAEKRALGGNKGKGKGKK